MPLSLGSARLLKLLSLRMIFILTIIILSACSAAPGSELIASSSNLPVTPSQLSPTPSSSVSEHSGSSAGQTPQETVPPPPQTPVTLGQPARVGAFTVMVHGIQWVDWREQVPGDIAYQQTQRLLVDVSLRNDTQRVLVWPMDARFTVLNVDGAALNTEYSDIQTGLYEGAVGLLPAEMQTEQCAKRVSDLLLPVTYLKRLLPGEVARRWLSYRQTPGLEQDDLQLEIELSGLPGDEQRYQAQFLLHGASQSSPLPSRAATAQLVQEGRLGEFAIKDAQIGPIGEIKDGLHRTLMPCTLQRTVTVHVENMSAQTEPFTTGIRLVDADGRVYEPLPIDDRYSFEPRQTQTISLMFPALLGVRDHPVALLLGEPSLYTAVDQTTPPQRLLLQLAEHP